MDAPKTLVFLLWFFPIVQSIDFIYTGFNKTDIVRRGAAEIRPSGALQLTDNSHNIIGQAFHPKPVQFFIGNNVSSFSTYFAFVIVPAKSNRGGFGLAFTICPSTEFPGAEAGHFLGILNKSNEGKQSNHLFAVEFDTVNGYGQSSDTDGNHVAINVNSMFSRASEPASYYEDGTGVKEEIILENRKAIQAWIDYDGANRIMNVTISPLSVQRPSRPLMSHPIDLSVVLKESMYVGFSAATGKKSSSHYILGWSFRVDGVAPPLDLSKLPLPPKEGKSSSSKLQVKVVVGVLSSLIVVSVVILLIHVLRRRRMGFESLEDWELDCPHRFKYRDLYAATRGFKESELLGAGGFGAVYKGVLPTTGAEIAVKKISNNSIQGLREFIAEIESLGRLRHKNLVNLQGWCKRRNDLLLVYDYVPYGSLNSLLFKPRNGFILSWEQRFNIIKGIAAGLLYLHEEWEKVVIHRDVKSSNILIDSEMNARLGDFGLARLHDHGKNSHTTHVVGTVGYIAPELAQTGKASTKSDVFAYGVLLLEVACGRGPIVLIDPQEGHLILANWVIQCLQGGRVLDAVDPKLNSEYVVEEMELVLGLGLLCCHSRAEARPSMRQITRYLNRDYLLLPVVDRMGDRVAQETLSKFLLVISADTFTTSDQSSMGGISTSSFESGR